MTSCYRRNVAIVVINEQGKLLACERSDLPGVWQLPQGGVEEGESEEKACGRELKEEVGIERFELIGCLPEKICYDFPEKHPQWREYVGQEQSYFLVRVNGSPVIKLNCQEKAEFRASEWLSVEEFLSRLSGFKTAAYTKGILGLKQLYPDFFF